MTVLTTQSKVTLQGNGSTTIWPFSFLIPNANYLIVIYTDTNGNQTTLSSTQYSVTGIGVSSGGSVIYPLTGSPIATGTTLTIIRETPVTQPTSLSGQGTLYPNVIEGASDNIVMQVQEIDTELSFTIQQPLVDPAPLGPLPAAAARINTVLGFSATGALQLYPPVTLTNVLAPNVLYTAPGTGAVSMPVSTKLALTVNVKDYGATGNSALENAGPEFAETFAVTPLGQETKFNVGNYRLDTQVLLNTPVALVGDNAAAGPGAVSNSNCSQLLANFASSDVVYVGTSTLIGSRFENFQINSDVGQRTSGAGIKLDATGQNSVVSNYRFNNLAFNNQYWCIQTQQGGIGTVENCYFQTWAQDAIHQAGDGVHEGQTGYVSQNYFFGATTASNTQNSCFYSQNGYGRIFNNLILGSQIGVRNYTGEFPSAAFEVVSNWIEEHDVSGVYMFQTNSQTGTMAAINWNEFSVATLGAFGRPNFQSHITLGPGTPAIWLTDFQIIGNRIRSCVSASANYISVEGAQYGIVQNNVIDSLTGSSLNGIRVQGSTQANVVSVLDNLIHGSFGTGARYVINNTTVMFRDFSSNLTVAELLLIVVSDGSMAWCADGVAGSNPLTGSGSGCIAIRERGAWKGLGSMAGFVRTLNTSYTLADTDKNVCFGGGTNATITLPAASTCSGREVTLKMEGGFTLSSATSNVIPLVGGSAGTAIITVASAGKFAKIVADGTNWTIMMAN